jgi:hypothetical protein
MLQGGSQCKQIPHSYATRVGEDGLCALDQPKQAPSRLQSVKSSGPVTGRLGEAGRGLTPGKSSVQGGLASSVWLDQPLSFIPVPQGRQEDASRAFSSFPQLDQDISHINPVHGGEWSGGGVGILLLPFLYYESVEAGQQSLCRAVAAGDSP